MAHRQGQGQGPQSQSQAQGRAHQGHGFAGTISSHRNANAIQHPRPQLVNPSTTQHNHPQALSKNSIPPMTQEQQEQWVKDRQIHQQQLLTEHFGSSPLSFVDDVINSVNNMIYQASMALQEFIEFQLQEITQIEGRTLDIKLETEKGMHKFETLLESSVDRNFDRFELYALKNIFGVPEDVDLVLPHYEALDFTIASEREKELDDELGMLRRQVIATKALNHKLRKELEMQENARRKYELCRDRLLFLKDTLNKFNDVAPLAQTMIFVRDNLDTLDRRFRAFSARAEEIAHQGHQPLLLPPSSSSSSYNSLSATALTEITPPETIPEALRETILSLPADQRALYFRTVVKRQADECLQTVQMEEARTRRRTMLSSGTTGGGGVLATPGTL
ncbi:hypothetical protein CPC16_002889 [Podila verticillata]|nr:hypothetical protein CPC16_002889 [Podila verticillata]KFH74143.1 hypothetical protein MVEG_01356 [Podila verticillata NRRL 6337]